MKDLRLYILMRNDLDSMKAGRAAAQASHASNAFIHKFGKNEEVKEWANQTPQGFGTAIVLSGDVKDIDCGYPTNNPMSFGCSDTVGVATMYYCGEIKVEFMPILIDTEVPVPMCPHCKKTSGMINHTKHETDWICHNTHAL